MGHVVMAMLIAWHTLNKAANPKDARFSDAFLIVAPGITIRDRLQVLLPSDPESYYRQRDIVPPDRLCDLGWAKIVVTNFHAFQLREKVKAPKLTKLVAGQQPGVFTETPAEMVRRVTRELGTKRNIVVLNDEAHHCYRRRVGAEDPVLESVTGEDRREAAKRDEEAGCGCRASKPWRRRPASGRSTTCPPLRSTCEYRGGRKGPCSNGSSRTSRSSTLSKRGW